MSRHLIGRTSKVIRVLVVFTASALLGAACSGGDSARKPIEVSLPDTLPFSAPAEQSTATTLEEISLGDSANPFGALPRWETPSAIRTDNGVVLPVVGRSDSGYQVRTPCYGTTERRGGKHLGRAHVVLDPGHGGREFGSTGSKGAIEKDLNLAVAMQAKAALELSGATVVLTREADYAVTLQSRAEIVNRVKPALFVSIHHNGGSAGGGESPGTIVFTGTGSSEAARFGGLFYEELTPFLEAAADAKIARWQEYEASRLQNEAEVNAYQASLKANRQALDENARRLAANGAAQGATASTQGTEPAVELMAVPETLPLPAAFEMEAVQPFSWAGSGYAGVRSWTTADGKDFLGVIRRTEEVPSVLAEFLYVTNPAEEELLLDPQFVSGEAEQLTRSITRYFGTSDEGRGFVADQVGEQDIGGGGSIESCVEPELEG